MSTLADLAVAAEKLQEGVPVSYTPQMPIWPICICVE